MVIHLYNDISIKKANILRFAILCFIVLCPSTCPIFSQNDKKYFKQKVEEAEEIYFYNYSGTILILEELNEIAELHKDDKSLRTACLYIESMLNDRHALHDSSLIERLNSHLADIEKQSPVNNSTIAYSQYSLALNYLIENQYIDGFFAALQSLSLAKTLNDTLHIARSLNMLGRISSQILNFSMAQDYHIEALSYLKEDNVLYYQFKANLFLINSFLQDHPQALVDSLSNLIEPIQRLGHPTFLFSLYSNLAIIHSIMEQNDLSLYYLNQIRNQLHLCDNQWVYHNLHLNFGFYYRHQGQLDSSLYYYEQAYHIAKKINNKRLINNSLYGITIIHDQLEETDKAYRSLKEYVATDRILNDNARILETSKQHIYSMLDYMQKEEEMHKQELVLRNTIITTVIILAIVALLVVALLLIIIKQKKSKQALLKETLDFKIREITSSSLLISNKNNVLNQIQEIIKEIKPTAKAKSKINEIHSLIRNNINTEQNWETFVIHFEQVHPGFFYKLQKHSSELTPTNLRFCAYFRLKLSTKEIATLLNITPSAVKTARFRLKKKFGLSEADSLDDFIANI